VSPSGTPPIRRQVPVLVVLANSQRPRRAPHARQGRAEDHFTSVEQANRLLAPLGLTRPIAEEDLDALSALASEASAVASSLAAGRPTPTPTVINELASRALGHRRLEIRNGAAESTVVWEYSSAACELANRLIQELGALDSTRLRECARPECTLVFYDTTRPGTQRWHAEDPCGWTERQRRRRRHQP
jgi:hypothetical protein